LCYITYDTYPRAPGSGWQKVSPPLRPWVPGSTGRRRGRVPSVEAGDGTAGGGEVGEEPLGRGRVVPQGRRLSPCCQPRRVRPGAGPRAVRNGTVRYGTVRDGMEWTGGNKPRQPRPPPRDRRRIRWRCSGGGDGCRILGRGRGEAGEVRRLAVLSDAAPQGVQPLPHLLRQVATTPPAFLGEGVGPAGPTVWEEGVGGDRRDEISAMIRAHGRGPRRRRPPCRGSSIAGVRGRRESGEAAGARTYPLPGRRKPCGSTAGPWGWGCPAGRGPGPEEEDGGCQTARRLLVTDYAEGSGRSPSPVSGLGREVKGGAWISHGEVLSGG